MPSGFRRWLLLLVTLLATVDGCAGSAPPFDELPLRDTLRADPEVVAALSDDARARLASRFQAAAAGDTAADPAEPADSVAAVLAQVDVARQRRAADALVIGAVGGGAVQALPSGTQARTEAPLPSLQGLTATTTADLEARALAGAAGASLRELLAASHAQRIERVVAWPAAAVVAGDTAYVNGAWLVAMAAPDADGGPADGGACDAGGCGAAAWGGRGGSMLATGAGGAVGGRGGAGGRWAATGGTPWTPPSTWTPPPPPSDLNTTNTTTSSDNVDVTVDSCDSGTGDSTDSCDSSSDDGSTDSCDGSSADDGSQDTCSAPPPDDGTTGDCQTAPHRRPGNATLIWLLAPLAYLWGRAR